MPDRSLDFWLTGWVFEPSVLAGLALVYSGYLLAIRRRRIAAGKSAVTTAQFRLFTAGIIFLAIALVSPLDVLSDKYWFNAHMTQHLFLTLVAPPLLLLGLPVWLFEPLGDHPALLSIARASTSPYFAFLAFNVIFAAWHDPLFYNLALENSSIHIVEHLSFIGAAILTWMPILSPTPLLPRVAPPLQVLYLFLQSLPPTLLGAIIVFANQPLYTFYEQAPRLWGVDIIEDQTWAGLIMWIGGAFIFLLVLTVVFFKWFGREETVEGQGFI